MPPGKYREDVVLQYPSREMDQTRFTDSSVLKDRVHFQIAVYHYHRQPSTPKRIEEPRLDLSPALGKLLDIQRRGIKCQKKGKWRSDLKKMLMSRNKKLFIVFHAVKWYFAS